MNKDRKRKNFASAKALRAFLNNIFKFLHLITNVHIENVQISSIDPDFDLSKTIFNSIRNKLQVEFYTDRLVSTVNLSLLTEKDTNHNPCMNNLVNDTERF